MPAPGAATAPAFSPSASARAVVVAFAASGFVFASWASRLPAVRDGLGYSEGQMGMLLLTAAIGSVLAIPLSGLFVERLGTRGTVALFATVLTAGAVLAVVGVMLGEHIAVRAGLLFFGVGAGVWDAGMNVEGAAVEQKLGRSVMPVFHAAFSFGTVVGAGIAALAASLAIPIEWHVSVAAAVSLAAVLVGVRSFLPDVVRRGLEHTPHAPSALDDPQSDPASALGTRAPATADAAPSGTSRLLAAWREPRTIAVGLVVLGAALTEGVANDWVSLAVVDGFGVSNAIGAIGLAVFLTAMTTGRLLGTRAIDRYGRVPVLRVSAVLAIVGVAVFALVPFLWLALVGVVLWGVGAALGFPVGMSAASDDPARAPMRVAVVSTIGYSAFFVGPPLIGFLAEHTGYRLAVLVLAVPVVLGLVVAGSARPLPTAAGGAPSTLER